MADDRPIDLFSPLSPEDIARKLRTIMADPMPNAKARVFGKGSERDMKLRYLRRNVRTNMEPALDAVMEAHAGGTRITGSFGAPPEARYFPCAWIGFLSQFVTGGVAALLFLPGAELFGIIFAGIPLLMMVAGIIAFRSQRPADEDLAEILGFLAREVDAHPVA